MLINVSREISFYLIEWMKIGHLLLETNFVSSKNKDDSVGIPYLTESVKQEELQHLKTLWTTKFFFLEIMDQQVNLEREREFLERERELWMKWGQSHLSYFFLYLK